MPPNGPESEVFVPITNKDVWMKLIELEKKVDSLNTRIYAFIGAVVVIAGFLSLTGGISVGS